MLNDKLGRLLKGNVRFSLQQGFIPDFLDACEKKNLQIRNLHEKDGVLHGSVLRHDYDTLQQEAQRKGMQISTEKRSGLSFMIQRYRKRWGIPVGLLLSLIIFGFLHSMVWQVQVDGCQKLSEAYIREYFAAHGVRRGVFQNNIDVVALRDQALYEMKEVLWISLYLDGCVAHIEVREREAQQTTADREPVNLVASYGGEIIRADIFEGEPYARPGKAVAKGDLLAGGALMMPGGGVRFVKAKADVIARTHRQIEHRIDFLQSVATIQDSSLRYCLSLFGLRVPLYPVFGKQIAEHNESNLSAGEVILPVGIIREGCRQTAAQDITLCKEVALLQLFAEFALLETDMTRDKTMLERSLQVEVRNNGIVMRGEYVCEENICQEVPLRVESES